MEEFERSADHRDKPFHAESGASSQTTNKNTKWKLLGIYSYLLASRLVLDLDMSLPRAWMNPIYQFLITKV